MNHKLGNDTMLEMIPNSLEETCWIDGLQRQVKLRRLALPELMLWCNSIENDDDNINIEGVLEMNRIFRLINRVATTDSCELSDDEKKF